ncbi:MAG: hypothetical protein HKN27_07365 [Silicimonas sp.]|nr:hypothetical protein [Silicimonas sp.]
MLSFPFRNILSAMLIALPAASFAKPVSFQCLMTSNEGWIAEQIFLEYDSESNSSRVADGVILHFEKKPIDAKILEDTDKKLVVSWNVVVQSRGQTTKMAYRLAHFRKNGKVIVNAKPHGYSNTFVSRGKCRATKQPFPIG